MIHALRARPRTRRHRVLAAALLGAVLLPSSFAAATFALTMPRPAPQRAEVAASPEATSSAPGRHDERQLSAAVVLGATGAESFDTLVPYRLLAGTGRFDVTVVAPTRRPLPLFAATPELHVADLLAHVTFDEHDATRGTPDLVVLPYFPDALAPGNEPVLAWVRDQVQRGARLLTICGGSSVAADAELLTDRRATSHRNLLPGLQARHPHVTWVHGHRWVEDGPVISSGGITAAIDATLRTIQHLTDPATAQAAAAAIAYGDRHLLDEPQHTVPSAATWVRTLHALLRPDRDELGVVLYPGVDEHDLAAFLDLHPRTYADRVRAVSVDDGPVVTRHGLTLLPREDGAAVTLDRALLPGTPPAGTLEPVTRWSERAGVPLDQPQAAARGSAIEAALDDIARTRSRAAAELVATGIEHPDAARARPGPAYPTGLLVRAMALTALGAGAGATLSRVRSARKANP